MIHVLYREPVPGRGRTSIPRDTPSTPFTSVDPRLRSRYRPSNPPILASWILSITSRAWLAVDKTFHLRSVLIVRLTCTGESAAASATSTWVTGRMRLGSPIASRRTSNSQSRLATLCTAKPVVHSTATVA